MTTRVFFSYSMQDEHLARLLQDDLAHDGIDVRDSGDAPLGTDIASHIATQIRSCDLLIAIFREGHRNVMFEIGFAMGAGKSVLILTEPPESMPPELSTLPCLQLTPDIRPELAEAVQRVLARTPQDTPRARVAFPSAQEELNTLTTEPSYFEALDYHRFEELIAEFFHSKGFDVTRSSHRADAGYDLLLRPSEGAGRVAVELKKLAKQRLISVDGVRQLMASVHFAGASSGLLVSTSGFTASAVAFAKNASPRLTLLSLDRLLKEENLHDLLVEPAAPIDFAILTTLESERRAVCAALGFGNENRIKKDGRLYWRGQLPLANGEAYELIVAQTPDGGNVEAAILATDVIRHWSPSAALLVGIAASARAGVDLGDVVVGRSIYYVERGKVTSDTTLAQADIIQADSTLLRCAMGIPDWTSAISVARPDGMNVEPRVHFGIIASGEKIIASVVARDDIASHHRKIMAIDMEGYGFSQAFARNADMIRTLTVRAICDDGGGSKSEKGWPAYAATVVAEFVKYFLLDRPLAPKMMRAG